MAGEIPSGEGSVFHFLDIYALGFGLEACAALFLGKSWWWVMLGVAGSIFFHLLGTKWPRIKPWIGPRFASAVERFSGNRIYRRVIYSVMAIALLASVGVRLYHHYHPSTETTKSVKLRPNSQTSVPPPSESKPPPGQPHPTQPKQRETGSAHTFGNKYTRMTNAELSEASVYLAVRVRKLAQDCRAESFRVDLEQQAAFAAAKSETERNEIWNKYNNRSIQVSQNCINTYNSQYKIDADLLHEELQFRALPGNPQSQILAEYDFPGNMIGMDAVADDLETMAKSLPGD